MEALRHDYLILRTQICADGCEKKLAPMFDYIAELEQELAKDDPEISRLRKVESAADAAVEYHRKGYDPNFCFDANHMLKLMNELDDTL